MKFRLLSLVLLGYMYIAGSTGLDKNTWSAVQAYLFSPNTVTAEQMAIVDKIAITATDKGHNPNDAIFGVWNQGMVAGYDK